MTQIRVNLLNLCQAKQVELELPCTDTEMQEKIVEAGIENDPLRPCAMIDLIDPVRLNGLSGSTVMLDELNFLAKRLDSFTRQEMEQFYTGVQYGGSLLLKDLINLTYNLHKYVLVRDVGSPEKIGLAYALQHEDSVPADYEKTEACRKLGKTLMNSGEGVFTDHGLLFVDEKPMEEVYDGVVFPDYDWEGGALLSVTLERDRYRETLYLPTEELTMEKSRVRLGATSLDDCVVSVEGVGLTDEAWLDRVDGIIDREGLLAANRLLERLAKKDMDLEKVDTLAHFFHDVRTAENLLILINHQNDFILADGVSSDKEVGRHFTEENSDYYLTADLQEYFDYDSFGEYMREITHGEFTDKGFLYYVGPDSPKEIFLLLDSEETVQGMKLS